MPLATTKEPVTEPEATEQTPPEMVKPAEGTIKQPLSFKLKVLPVTVTVVPMGPAAGESVIVGLFTVNVVESDPCCTQDAPDMVTVCAP